MPRRARPIADRFEEKLDKTTSIRGCWLWTGSPTSNGYGQISRGGKYGAQIGAHVCSWGLRNGAVPKGLCVMHKCDTPLCVNPDHLSLGTHVENVADRVRKNRSAYGDRSGMRLHPERVPRGERHGNSILTTDRVKFIKRDKRPTRHMARLMGVSQSTVSHIRTGRLWAHVSVDTDV